MGHTAAEDELKSFVVRVVAAIEHVQRAGELRIGLEESRGAHRLRDQLTIQRRAKPCRYICLETESL
jgi:hypothetical protein